MSYTSKAKTVSERFTFDSLFSYSLGEVVAELAAMTANLVLVEELIEAM